MNGARTTIVQSGGVEGVGLHLGQPCRLVFRPAPARSGITFVRVDRGGRRIPARADVAVLAERRTQLGDGEDALHTVEHVLAAVAGSGIDDLDIELDGPEPPIADGSARPFVEVLQAAGVAPTESGADYLSVAAPFTFREGDAEYDVSPASSFELDVSIEFPHPLVGRQRGSWSVTPETFAGYVSEGYPISVRGVPMFGVQAITRGNGFAGDGSYYYLGTIYGRGPAEDPRFEPMPDIDAERDRHVFLSWDMAPGDVIAFHARTVHGAPGNAQADRRRRAYATRWLGADARYAERPGTVSPPKLCVRVAQASASSVTL